MKTYNYYKLFTKSFIYGLNKIQEDPQINVIDCITDYFYKEYNKNIQEQIFNELLKKLRNASEEERQAVEEYIENNSTTTNVSFFDLIEKL